MKNVFLTSVMALFCLINFVNCSDNKYPDNLITNNPNKVETLTTLSKQIDSLGYKYSKEYKTRGILRQMFDIVSADVFGAQLGKAAGGALGGVIGGLSGGHIGAAAGAATGATYGRWIGAGIGSAIVAFDANIVNIPGNKDSNTDICVSQGPKSIEDSIGLFHNQVMRRIFENRSAYIKKDGEVDKNKIYDDCVKFYADLGVVADSLSKGEKRNYKQTILRYADESVKISKAYREGSISAEQLFDYQMDVAKKYSIMTERDIELYLSVTKNIILQCCGIEREYIEEYAKDINYTISESDLPNIEKSILAESAQIAINSRLCWQE